MFQWTDDVPETVDSDRWFVELVHFFGIFSPHIDTYEGFVHEEMFSPVHLRSFFVHPPAGSAELERPYWHYLRQTSLHWRAPPGEALVGAIAREYRRNELDEPFGLFDNNAERYALLAEMTVQQRIRLLYDVVCVFLPWNGDYFRDSLLGGKEPTFSSLRPIVFPNDRVLLVADRFLYYDGLVLAYDRTSWDTLLVVNPWLRSRKQADKETLELIRVHMPDAGLLAFDERCRRHTNMRLQVESRKRSPRIVERTARKQALDRLARQAHQGDSHGRRHIFPVPAIHRESRAARLARREQTKTISQARRDASEHSLGDADDGQFIDVECPESAATDEPSPERLVLRLPSSQWSCGENDYLVIESTGGVDTTDSVMLDPLPNASSAAAGGNKDMSIEDADEPGKQAEA